MKTIFTAPHFWPRVVGICIHLALMESAFAVENIPPRVKIAWPNASSQCDMFLGAGAIVRIKAEAYDSDGAIAEVRFYMLTNLIGIVTNPPYTVVWMARPALQEITRLRAVATDNLGATTESEWVQVDVYTGAPPLSIAKILSPLPGSIFLESGEFEFTAEMLASYSAVGPIEFFVGSNLVGVVNQSGVLTATSPPPASVTVSNLAEGEYDLYVRYAGTAGDFCACCYEITNRIRVARLGVQMLPHPQGEPFRFEVLTSFPDRPTVIERSPDLLDWSPISTNSPSTNRFTFTDPVDPGATQRFYRVVVPLE